MTRLTEEMVIARSKQSDLSSIKKLNCWGSELTDVSIMKRMTSVEILALSINKIRTLVDFQYCRRLKELYVRKNKIADLSEIRHLRGLPALKILWLEENPCAEANNYRMTVLRALPHLEKLDNVNVESEEVEEAARKGMPIVDTDGEDDYEPELENYNNQYWAKAEEAPSERNGEKEEYRNGDQDSERGDTYETPTLPTATYGRPSALRRSPPTTNGNRHSQEYDRQHEESSHSSNNHYNRPSALPRSPPTTNGSSHIQTSPSRSNRCYSPDSNDDRYERPPTSRPQYFERSASMGDELSSQPTSQLARVTEDAAQTSDLEQSQRRQLQHSQSAQSIKEYTPVNGEHNTTPRYQQPPNNRHSVELTSPQATQQHSDYYYERPDRYSSQNLATSEQNFYQQPRQQQQQQDQWERDSMMSAAKEREGQIASAVMADHKGFTRRPMTRSSNLLSAVLCLIKELDYTSLEVAEMAVRCRMDELANRP